MHFSYPCVNNPQQTILRECIAKTRVNAIALTWDTLHGGFGPSTLMKPIQ
jgi:hypothetical protein